MNRRERRKWLKYCEKKKLVDFDVLRYHGQLEKFLEHITTRAQINLNEVELELMEYHRREETPPQELQDKYRVYFDEFQKYLNAVESNTDI